MPLQKNISIFLLMGLVLSFLGCRQTQTQTQQDKDKVYPSPAGYRLNNPYVVTLNSELDEISGVSFYAKDTSVFAISDDKGSLYKVHLKNKFPIEKWKFSEGDDYEDVVLADSNFYVLASSGNITALNYSIDKPMANTYEFDLQGNNEFEVLYKDTAYKKLVLLCKDCEADNKNAISAFSFDVLTHTFADTPYFKIDVSPIAERLGKDKLKFKPSAACINPVTGDLYIISSVNKVLVIADARGSVKDVFPLNPTLYKQPEGLTFTAAGDMIISNERADIGSANILIFKYKSPAK